MDTMPNPKIVDDDAGEISAMLYGKQLRGWSYHAYPVDTHRH
jgi:hypothetical protein